MARCQTGVEIFTPCLLQQQQVLMALGNACSDSFDVASSETRLRLRGSGVLPQLLPLLEGTDGTIQLYATALLLNMCKDMELAVEACACGVM